MKKLLATAALLFSFAAQAFTVDTLTLVGPIPGPTFSPVGSFTLSTQPGFLDNFTTSVGGTVANFGSQQIIVYSTTLPGDSNVPAPGEFYGSQAITGQLASLLTYAAPLVVNAETSAALQLAVWSVAGNDFSVVDDLNSSNAEFIAGQWITASAGFISESYGAFSLESKPFTGFVYVSAVPEPTSAAILALGVAALSLYVRRRHLMV